MSGVKLVGHKVNNDHDGNSNLLRICQQSDGTVETVDCSLPELAAIADAVTTYTITEETLTLEEFLQKQALNRECHAAVQTVGFPALLFMYDADDILE